MQIDQLQFQQHIQEASFQIGIDEGYWDLHNTDLKTSWPFVIIWIKAREVNNLPGRYYFRFDLSGYPSQAPTSCPWDVKSNTKLNANQWPKGGRITMSIFNPQWNPSALYIPCDRTAQKGHEAWKDKHPELWWQRTDDITKYLTFLHRTLNSKDYGK